MLTREIVTTEDGSSTIFLPEWNESYHSKHGAIQEANHVFIQNGLALMKEKQAISILELGFGTGLNVLMSALFAKNNEWSLRYTSLEKFPVLEQEFSGLNYAEAIRKLDPEKAVDSTQMQQLYRTIMQTEWHHFQEIQPNFQLKKVETDFFAFEYPSETYDLVYFDAFGARVQPELWTENMFEKIYGSMKKDGVLTTYASNGNARRAMIAVGFQVEKRPGPPGKREMLIAIK